MPGSHQVYLSLGTNLGDRLDNLRQAYHGLAGGLYDLEASSVFETEPWGYADQPAFLNMAAGGKTNLTPEDLLSFIKDLEQNLGRLPSFRYGPRKIDIDILFYDDLVLTGELLTIPHPRLTERAFVLVPLAELAPDLLHPVAGCTIPQLSGAVDARGVKFYKRI